MEQKIQQKYKVENAIDEEEDVDEYGDELAFEDDDENELSDEETKVEPPAAEIEHASDES